MKIVIRKSDSKIAQVANCDTLPGPAGDFEVHDIPNWDWSLADMTGVDRTQENWVENQMMWSEERQTLVPRPA